jgi:hypothetical protein
MSGPNNGGTVAVIANSQPYVRLPTIFYRMHWQICARANRRKLRKIGFD